jgi:hypothetical protein
MGIFGKALLGATVGAGYKAWNSNGNVDSMIGGAVAGGLVGAGGAMLANKAMRGLGNIGNRLGIARMARSGLGMGVKAARSARIGMTGIAANQVARGSVGRLGVAAGYGADAMRAFGGAAAASRRYIGQNASTINKYGGYAVAGIGAASAAYIGSSVLNSNRRS